MRSSITKTLPLQTAFKFQAKNLPSPSHSHLETQKTHAHLFKSGLIITTTSILPERTEQYCKMQQFSDARQVFNEMPEWDLVSTTALMGRFSRQGRLKDSIGLFSCLLFSCVTPNEFTFATLIHASTTLRNHEVFKQLHPCSIKTGFYSNVFVGSAILYYYAKLGDFEDTQKAFEDTHEPNVVSYTALIGGYLKNEKNDDALELFWKMPYRNVVSWNAMIGGFSQRGHNEEAINLFVKMCREGTEKPNESTFPCVFSAAANIGALGIGKNIHSYAVKLSNKLDVFVGNSLISFYAKCGSMEDSRQVFDRIAERNVVSWNALICGYAQNGRGKEALEIFEEMKVSGFKPNGITLLCLLFACNHAGLVDDGFAYFDLVRRKEPDTLRSEHYACMVDLFSRSGRVSEAERFLQELPFDPGIGFWKSLLGGCQIHSNMDLAKLAARKILELEPGDSSSYISLSNFYAFVDQWQNVSKIRKEMKEKGMKRITGCSWIEIRSKVYSFVTGDRKYVQKDEIYMILNGFYQHLMELEYECKYNIEISSSNVESLTIENQIPF